MSKIKKCLRTVGNKAMFFNTQQHWPCGRIQNFEYLTSNPSKTYAWSSEPSSLSGVQPGLAQPTLIGPVVSISNSKYHFPWVTAYDLSGLNTLHFSVEKRHAFDDMAVNPRNREKIIMCQNNN